MNAEDRTRALKLAAAYPEGGEGSMSSLLAYHVRLYEETLRATEEESRMLREALERISRRAPERPTKGYSYMIDEHDIAAVREALNDGSAS